MSNLKILIKQKKVQKSTGLISIRLLTNTLKIKKTLNSKILNFILNIIKLNSQKDFNLVFSNRRIYHKLDYAFYKTASNLLKTSFIFLSFLKGFSVKEKTFFESKNTRLIKEIFLYLKHRLFLVLFINSEVSKKFKIFYLNFIVRYLAFNLYFVIKDFLKTFELNQSFEKLETTKPILEKKNILINQSLKKSSSDFYKKQVFNTSSRTSCLSRSLKKISIEKDSISTILKRISKNVMKEKKRPLDDNKLSKTLSNIRRCLKKKNVTNPKTLFLLQKTVNKIKPLYKVVYQRRGRNKIGVAKYLFINNIRESIALKWVLNSCNSSLNNKVINSKIESKLACILLDTFFDRGQAFAQFKDSTKTTMKGGRLLNKGFLLKTTKPLLSK